MVEHQEDHLHFIILIRVYSRWLDTNYLWRRMEERQSWPGAFRGGWRSVTTPSTAGKKSAGADLEQMRSKQRASFESRWTRIEKFDDSFHSGGWEH